MENGCPLNKASNFQRTPKLDSAVPKNTGVNLPLNTLKIEFMPSANAHQLNFIYIRIQIITQQVLGGIRL